MTKTAAAEEDYNAGLAWGRTEGVAAVPADVTWNSISGMRYADSAYAQCAEAGMGEMFCRGAFDGVYRTLTWGDRPSAPARSVVEA